MSLRTPHDLFPFPMLPEGYFSSYSSYSNNIYDSINCNSEFYVPFNTSPYNKIDQDASNQTVYPVHIDFPLGPVYR